MFRGCFVALVTPMRNGAVDEPALRSHVEWMIESGVHGLVPCGTTGECPTLSREERIKVIEITARAAKGSRPVVAGAGTNDTAKTIAMVGEAKAAGADAALVVTPYYNKPTQEGLYRHFAAVAEAVDFPLVLYNVPGRTGVNMLPETVQRLAGLPNVVSVKEASGTASQTIDILRLAPRLSVLSGDDNMYLPHLAVGAHGVISVMANIAPGPWSELYNHFSAGRFDTAQEIFVKLFPACQALFIETSPIPVKTALGLMGRMSPELRLPLCGMSEANKARLAKVLAETEILEEAE